MTGQFFCRFSSELCLTHVPCDQTKPPPPPGRRRGLLAPAVTCCFDWLSITLMTRPKRSVCRLLSVSPPPVSSRPPPGGLSSSSDGPPVVVRYSKDQRPTTLPIQPFTFHHQFASKPLQPKPLRPLLTGYAPGMQAPSGSGSAGVGTGGEDSEDAAENGHSHPGGLTMAAPPPGSVRPSPLGSYSPVRLQGAPSSGTCSTCTPSPPPSHSPSCPLSGGLGPPHSTPPTSCGPLPLTPPPPSLGAQRGAGPPPLHRGALVSDTLSPLGYLESGKHTEGSRGARTQNGECQTETTSAARCETPPGSFFTSGDHSTDKLQFHPLAPMSKTGLMSHSNITHPSNPLTLAAGFGVP